MPESHGHDWVGVPEAAAYLGIIQRTLHRMIERGATARLQARTGDPPALGRHRGVHRGLPRSARRPVPPLPARRPRPPPQASSSTARTRGVRRFPTVSTVGPVSPSPSIRYGGQYRAGLAPGARAETEVRYRTRLAFPGPATALLRVGTQTVGTPLRTTRSLRRGLSA
jgi:hypothetical protein